MHLSETSLWRDYHAMAFVVWLSIAQTVSWGIMFYGFAPQDYYRASYEADLQLAKDAGIELDAETIELMSIKEKGLHGDRKDVIEKFLEG